MLQTKQYMNRTVNTKLQPFEITHNTSAHYQLSTSYFHIIMLMSSVMLLIPAQLISNVLHSYFSQAIYSKVFRPGAACKPFFMLDLPVTFPFVLLTLYCIYFTNLSEFLCSLFDTLPVHDIIYFFLIKFVILNQLCYIHWEKFKKLKILKYMPSYAGETPFKNILTNNNLLILQQNPLNLGVLYFLIELGKHF